MLTTSNSKIERLVLVLALVLVSSVSFTQNAKVSCPFKPIPPMGFVSFFWGINDAGAVVGTWSGVREGFFAFVLYRGNEYGFDFPGTENATEPHDINKQSQIVGTYNDASGRGHGFVVRNRAFQTIDFPGATSTDARGINSSGDIVGSYLDARQRRHAYLLHEGRFVSFSFPGAQETGENGINDHAVIVGAYSDGTHYHGFRVKNGHFDKIDFPGATDTSLSKVNNAGLIVGGAKGNAFALVNGKFITIVAPDGNPNPMFITGLNNLKQIVGLFLDQGFEADCEGVF